MNIKFNSPYVAKNSEKYLRQALQSSAIGSSHFCDLASEKLSTLTNAKKVFLTNSCTSALEMAVLLANIQPGDEIIMPSYTFVSTASAFVLRGAVPVFIDIRPDTLNMDETKIEAAITPKTKAIVPVHYAGVGCEMDTIMQIANHHRLWVIEDAAQGILAQYKNKYLGSIGHMGALSFHHTKNITSGAGGALLVNDESLIERAKIIWQKGTNRDAFLAGRVDKYTWIDIGSSFMASEITAALLYAQLEEVIEIIKTRLAIWHEYQQAFTNANNGFYNVPYIPVYCSHNAHIYYLLLKNAHLRSPFMRAMSQAGIEITFHYIPLHTSPAGLKHGRCANSPLTTTDQCATQIVRLPLYPGLTSIQIKYIIDCIIGCLATMSKTSGSRRKKRANREGVF